MNMLQVNIFYELKTNKMILKINSIPNKMEFYYVYNLTHSKV